MVKKVCCKAMRTWVQIHVHRERAGQGLVCTCHPSAVEAETRGPLGFADLPAELKSELWFQGDKSLKGMRKRVKAEFHPFEIWTIRNNTGYMHTLLRLQFWVVNFELYFPAERLLFSIDHSSVINFKIFK